MLLNYDKSVAYDSQWGGGQFVTRISMEKKIDV